MVVADVVRHEVRVLGVVADPGHVGQELADCDRLAGGPEAGEVSLDRLVEP
jgi:hypothetical protein